MFGRIIAGSHLKFHIIIIQILHSLTFLPKKTRSDQLSDRYSAQEKAAAPSSKKGNVIIHDIDTRPLSVVMVDSEDRESVANSSVVSVEMLQPTQSSRLGVSMLSANRYAIGNTDTTGSIGSLPGSSSLVNSEVASTVGLFRFLKLFAYHLHIMIGSNLRFAIHRYVASSNLST